MFWSIENSDEVQIKLKSRQGRRRFLKTGKAIERHRRSARAEGSSGVEGTRGGHTPCRKGVRGSSPRKFLNLTCL